MVPKLLKIGLLLEPFVETSKAKASQRDSGISLPSQLIHGQGQWNNCVSILTETSTSTLEGSWGSFKWPETSISDRRIYAASPVKMIKSERVHFRFWWFREATVLVKENQMVKLLLGVVGFMISFLIKVGLAFIAWTFRISSFHFSQNHLFLLYANSSFFRNETNKEHSLKSLCIANIKQTSPDG